MPEPQHLPQPTPPPDPGALGLLDALITGIGHSYHAVTDDLSDWFQTGLPPRRMLEQGLAALNFAPRNATQMTIKPLWKILLGAPSEERPSVGMALQAPQASGGSTLEGLIGALAQAGRGIGGRGQLIPAIRTKTGEVFSGSVGGTHPTEMVTRALTQRRMPVGNLTYGFQLPGEQHFLSDTLANALRFPDGVKRVHGMLSKGSTLDDVLEALRFGAEQGKTF